MTQLKRVSESELEQLAPMADEIWHECFTGIITLGQIDYMVERFQSLEAMRRQTAEEDYEYYWVNGENGAVGYMAIKPEPEHQRVFLSKLYLKKDSRGLGHASAAIDLLRDMCGRRGFGTVWLTVNRGNSRAIDTYLHKGFVIVREQCADIGNGYVMDDYVMELRV